METDQSQEVLDAILGDRDRDRGIRIVSKGRKEGIRLLLA
jgi:hypothetical protein